jgi:thioredoxin 1
MVVWAELFHIGMSVAKGDHSRFPKMPFVTMSMNAPIPAVTDETFCRDVLCRRYLALVQFSAEWSGASHLMTPTLERLGRGYAGRLKVFHIDVDSNPAVRKRFGIHDVPTLLLFRRGVLVAGYYGAVSSKRIARDVDEMMGLDNSRPHAHQRHSV